MKSHIYSKQFGHFQVCNDNGTRKVYQILLKAKDGSFFLSLGGYDGILVDDILLASNYSSEESAKRHIECLKANDITVKFKVYRYCTAQLKRRFDSAKGSGFYAKFEAALFRAMEKGDFLID